MAEENCSHATSEDAEIFEFQGEASKLLEIMTSCFYPYKEFFIRELVCNAVDALERVRYVSNRDPSVQDEGEELHIRIISDCANRTLSIIDNGIGMTKLDLVNNLGSIAHSGTRDFKKQLQPDSGVALIGHYGLGFYSTFMVANKVQVISKNADDEQYLWEYTGGSSYTIFPYDKEQIGRGTKVILHLKDEQTDILAPFMLSAIMDCFFEFIDYPIRLEDIGELGCRVPLCPEYRRIKPLWMYEPEEIKQEEYENLFKWMTLESSSHLLVKHVKYKGTFSFRALIFIPTVAPIDYCWNTPRSHNVRLFTRRVQISEYFPDLLPNYMNFVYALADSDDVLLNANHSDFHNPVEKQLISEVLTEKVFEMIEEIAEKPEIFDQFHRHFSESIKLGAKTDPKNRHRLLSLISYHTLNNGNRAMRLKDYVAQMRPHQRQIYYITGDDLNVLSNSPLTEDLKKRGYDVILMDSMMDEYIVNMIVSYDNKELVDVSATNLKISSSVEEEEDGSTASSGFESTCKKIKEILADQVEGVIISDKLVDTPCCISASKPGISLNMERIMKRHQQGDLSTAEELSAKKYFEINPKDSIIHRLREMLDQAENPSTSSKNIVTMLYSAALLSSGYTLEKPRSFTKIMYSFINMYLRLGCMEAKENAETELNEKEITEELSFEIDSSPMNALN